MVKKILFTLYILVIVCMGTATIVEKYEGTDFVDVRIYGAWWFSLLWAMLAAAAVVWIVRRKMRNWLLIVLHASLLVILAGALITHLSARRGVIHLRTGSTVNTYLAEDGETSIVERQLPFSVKLERFDITYHNGTRAVADYTSHICVEDGRGETVQGTVSMNKIFSYKSVRLYQSSFDEDGRGSILSVNSDPYGIPVTYGGYGLLFFSLIFMLVSKNGPYRKLLQSAQTKRGGLLMAVLIAAPLLSQTKAAETLPAASADSLGRLYVLYNDRICPLQTLAIDFTKKLYGKSSYNGHSAEQVVAGWIFWGNEWSNEPLIKIKGGALKTTLGLPPFASVNTFFGQNGGNYILGPYVQEYHQGNRDALHKQAAELDDKIQLVMELRRGTLLKIFPYTPTRHGKTMWYSPTEDIPADVPHENKLFIQNAFSLLNESIQQGQTNDINELLSKMRRYQRKYGGDSLPTFTQTAAERIYNQIPFATLLFMLNLTLGFATLFYTLYKLARKDGEASLWVRRGTLLIFVLSFCLLTCCEALRWIISGNVPMANGYETMLFVAWLIMLLSLFAYKRFHIVLTFGFIMSGFFLLVSHINQMNPNISHLMPVLNSPLLSVHVSVIMTSFALLSITFICGIVAIVLPKAREPLQLLSRLFLYPALSTLGIGIFIGAVWANVSWGRYWSWDPKEVWALITFLTYAVVVHTHTLPIFQKPLSYHIFITVAFLSILMTYFGVNYFLGGMHSYA